MSDPKVSLLVPAFNAESTLGATLDCLVAQSLQDWEAIIIDDGSADETLALGREYASRDSRFRVESQPNRGAASARNRAASLARAQWLAPLDADDLIVPDALTTMCDFAQAHTDYAIISCTVGILASDGSVAPWPLTDGLQAPTEFSLQQFIAQNRAVSFALVSRDAFDRVGGYREVYVEDYDLFLRVLAAGGRQVTLPEQLFIYRRAASGKNSAFSKSMSSTAEVLLDLSREASIPEDLQSAARERSEEWFALAARAAVEESLSARDYRHFRRHYLKARSSFQNQLSWFLALPVVLASPRLFGALGVYDIPANNTRL